MAAAALEVLAHAGPHQAGKGHGTSLLAIFTVVILVGGWAAVGVAAWVFLRRGDEHEPADHERAVAEAAAANAERVGAPAAQDAPAGRGPDAAREDDPAAPAPYG